jgi:hypothetical protein
VTPAELVQYYPRLYHMAHQGGWPSIRDHGLMSASALLDAYCLSGPERAALESSHRPESVHLVREGLPGAVLRDQKPMSDSALEGCLQHGLLPKDWYEILNAKSFFWLSSGRIWRLLQARAYRGHPQTVLTLSTEGIVKDYKDRILLSPINSGSTLFNPQPRGEDTFKKIEDFRFSDRAKTRALENNVVELVIDHSVPDIAKYVVAVHEVLGDTITDVIWRSPDASDDDRP